MRRVAAAVVLVTTTAVPVFGDVVRVDAGRVEAAPVETDLVFGDPPPVETDPRPLVVHGALEGTTAIFKSHYVVAVRSGPDNTVFALPRASLVIRATVTVDGSAHELALVESHAAEAAFSALENAASGLHPAWAVKLASEADGVAITTVVPHAGFLTFDLEISSPTCFSGDTRYVPIPATWEPALDPALQAARAPISEIRAACGESRESPFIGFPSGELARHPAGDGRLGALGGRLPVGVDHLARVELDLASRISEVPRDLATVVVVDGSRSMSARELATQRAVVAAYLRAAPSSRVQVVAYARNARALLPSWMVASAAMARIDEALRSIDTRNGSNVDAGLVEAAAWLARIRGAHRILLVTDELMTDRLAKWTPAALKGLISGDTLVQVVAVDRSDTPLARVDDAAFAGLAAATEGMAVRTGSIDPALDATLLARPISLDHVVIHAPGWTPITPIAGASCGRAADQRAGTIPEIGEGAACTWWGEGSAAAGPVVLEGLTWGHRVRRVITPDPAAALAIARELSAAGTLDEILKTRVDMLAHAVNAAWSMFATWGGPDGYAQGLSLGGRGIGSICCSGDFGTMGSGHGTGSPAVSLKWQLANAVMSCHPGAHRVSVALELTAEEIVDVSVTIDDPGQRTLRDCIADEIWLVSLVIDTPQDHQTVTVAFDRH